MEIKYWCFANTNVCLLFTFKMIFYILPNCQEPGQVRNLPMTWCQAVSSTTCTAINICPVFIPVLRTHFQEKSEFHVESSPVILVSSLKRDETSALTFFNKSMTKEQLSTIKCVDKSSTRPYTCKWVFISWHRQSKSSLKMGRDHKCQVRNFCQS